MARKQNELSAIQKQPEIYAGIRAQIKRLTVDRLSRIGSVSHMSIKKYLDGDPVNPTTEQEILEAIKLAEETKQTDDNKRLEDAKKLIPA